MTALRARRRSGEKPSEFTTYTEVEVNIDPSELEAEGWRYVGTDESPTTRHVIDVVRRWHDEAHVGPWQWCSEEPCDTLRGRGEDA